MDASFNRGFCTSLPCNITTGAIGMAKKGFGGPRQLQTTFYCLLSPSRFVLKTKTIKTKNSIHNLSNLYSVILIS